MCSTDTPKELAAVQAKAREAGAFDAVICSHWAHGGAGAKDLAAAVEKAAEQPADFKFLYNLDVSSTVYQLNHNLNSNFALWREYEIFTVFNVISALSLKKPTHPHFWGLS